jgi:hypothetical protein
MQAQHKIPLFFPVQGACLHIVHLVGILIFQ